MRTSLRMRALMLGCGVPLCVCSAVARAQARANERPAPIGARDTLVLTRRQAIALALRANPQIAIAREQTLQVRAQRVEGNAIADPVLSASLDSLTGLRASVPRRSDRSGYRRACRFLTSCVCATVWVWRISTRPSRR
jgi:outer membrane protein TolC